MLINFLNHCRYYLWVAEFYLSLKACLHHWQVKRELKNWKYKPDGRADNWQGICPREAARRAASYYWE